jgi:hypothetical protein
MVDTMTDFKQYNTIAAKKYLSLNLSIIPLKSDKSPAVANWKPFQSERMQPDKIPSFFQGEMVEAIGIICGEISGNLEVIDVDCKYDNTGSLWNDLKGLICDNLPDVYDRLVIASTKNKGYHIYYKCEVIEGNQKFANRETTAEERDLNPLEKVKVLIESRGEGGYVVAAPSQGYRFIQGKTDLIPTISKDDRECLLAICRSFDTLPQPLEITHHRQPEAVQFEGISTFDDYQNKGDIVSLMESHGFTVVKQSGDRIHLKRPGTTDSKQSGNIQNGLYYNFSTSTQFEAGRAYNIVQVYSILECNGDMSEASHRLREAGYGDSTPQLSNLSTKRVKAVKSPVLQPLPIDGMPPFVQEFITACSDTFCTPRDYWAASVIMAVALSIGNKIQLNGRYKNVPILWMNLIGDVSTGKTEAGNICLKFFEEMDNKAVETFKLEYQTFKEVEAMSAKDRKIEGIEKTQEPVNFQYIVKDATPEALTMVHSVNQRDELKGWLDDFNRYSKSGEQSNFLSSFSQVRMVTNRKGGGADKVLSISNPHILVFGGMQPDLLPTLAADNRQENGFLARFCNVWPDIAQKPEYSNKVLPAELLRKWENYLSEIMSIREQINVTLSNEAETLYKDWFNRNAAETNNEESGYLKGVYGKLDIIALRLSIISHTMSRMDYPDISADEMQAALNITEYFRATALKVYHKLFDQKNVIDTKVVIKHLSGLGNSQTEIAKVMKVSQPYINKILK